MKRVLFVTNSLGFAGVEKMIAFIAGELQDRGFKCCIANLNNVPDYVNKQQQNIHEEVNVCALEKPQDTENKNAYYIRKLKEIAREFSADVLIGFTAYPNMYARIVGFLLGIPSIMSERGDPSRTGLTKGLKNKLSLMLINSSKGGVFQTEGAMSVYGKGLQKRSVVIPNPIFIKGEIPEVPQSERQKTVVSVGRLDNFQKRYDVMLEAFRLFSQKHPEYTLKLYGDGSDTEQIKQWAVDLGIADKVNLMGLTRQPMQDIAHDGMFLITSDFEGISNSLLEAMAVGLPCVSTDHTPGGARMLITDHENGLLAPVEDAPALAAAMCEFAENPELAEKCGNNAKDVVNRFAPERIIKQWEMYIAEITNK